MKSKYSKRFIEKLKELYLGKKFSIIKVAKELNCPRGTIKWLLQKYEIPTRNMKEAQRLNKYWLNRNHTKTTIKKMKKSAKVRQDKLWQDPEYRKNQLKNFIWQKGHIPWNKGLTKETSEKVRQYGIKGSNTNKGKPGSFLGKHHTDESNRKNALSHKGKICSDETKRKMSLAHKGKIKSEEHRRRLSLSLKGNIIPEKVRRKISATVKKIESDPQIRKQMSERGKKLWRDTEYVKKMFLARRTTPNKAELKLNTIIQKTLPNEYALNVRAEIMTLGSKIPDFVNINGQKKVIELYGDYFHNPKYFPNHQSSEKRISYFKQFGWDTLIIWEHELQNLDSLKEKVKNFNSQEGF